MLPLRFPELGVEAIGEPTTTLTNGINDLVSNRNTIRRSITIPSTGTNFIKIDNEEISYTGISGNELTGVTREVRGTTKAAHSGGAIHHANKQTS